MAGDITIKKTKGFTTILNEPFQRNDLSWKAKGLLAYLMTCSEEWVIYKKDLKNRSTDGYDSTVTAFNELQSFGYIEVIENRDNGLFSSPTYIVHETPIRDFPDTVSPERENPRLINNSSKKDIHTEQSKTLDKKARAEQFKSDVLKINGYSQDFLDDFCEYWCETSDKVKTLRFEDQKYFDISRRLSTYNRLTFGKGKIEEQKKPPIQIDIELQQLIGVNDRKPVGGIHGR